MLRTNLKILMIGAKTLSGMTWKEIGEKLGKGNRSNLIALAYRTKTLSKNYVDIMDAMGFDVHVTITSKRADTRKKGE